MTSPKKQPRKSLAPNADINLRLDWASHDAARYACENWHYSRCLPCGKLVKIGVWENGAYIGCVIFGRGANNNIGKPYGLEQTEICELVRVALKTHQTPVSKIMGVAVRLLRKQYPALKLLVSYADPEQGHHGGIYQACGWNYVGISQPQQEVMYRGRVMHKRTANAMFGTIKGMEKSKVFWKHKYLLPLNPEMVEHIKSSLKPYPKREHAPV